MNRISTIVLQIGVVALGIGALVLMLWEPHLEGRNAGATLYQIYFNDPFLVYAYAASISFFVGLYQVFKLLGYAGRNEVLSQAAQKALRTIKYCALALVGFVAAPLAYLFVIRPDDDIAGGVAIGLFLIVCSAVVAAAAAAFEKRYKVSRI